MSCVKVVRRVQLGRPVQPQSVAAHHSANPQCHGLVQLRRVPARHGRTAPRRQHRMGCRLLSHKPLIPSQPPPSSSNPFSSSSSSSSSSLIFFVNLQLLISIQRKTKRNHRVSNSFWITLTLMDS